jgi:hypothetical protein
MTVIDAVRLFWRLKCGEAGLGHEANHHTARQIWRLISDHALSNRISALCVGFGVDRHDPASYCGLNSGSCLSARRE